MAVLDIDAAASSVTATLGAARGLPNACYTDPDYHRLEARKLFARTWTCVGVGADIPEPGDILPVMAAGSPIVLVRDKAHAVNAFHNVCSHRGVQLVAEPESRKPVLRCPYHSWTYGLDGSLIHTPMIDGPDRHDCPAVEKAAWADAGSGRRLERSDFRQPVWDGAVARRLHGAADRARAAYDFSALRHAPHGSSSCGPIGSWRWRTSWSPTTCRGCIPR